MLNTFEESTVSVKDSGATELKCKLLFSDWYLTSFYQPESSQKSKQFRNYCNTIILWVLFQLEIINTRAGWLHLLTALVCADIAEKLSFFLFFCCSFQISFVFACTVQTLFLGELFLFLFPIKWINVTFLLSNKYQSQNVVLWLTIFKRGSSDRSTLLVEVG